MGGWGWRLCIAVALTALLLGGCATSPAFPNDAGAAEARALEQEIAEGRSEYQPDPADIYAPDEEPTPVDMDDEWWEDPLPESTQESARCAPGGCETHLAGCDIKGNIAVDSGEKIYHLPGQRYYEQTKISPSYGERWFCSEADAVAAGWRKARE